MAGQLVTSPYNPGYAPTPAAPGFGTQTDWFTQNAPPGTAGPAPTAPGTLPNQTLSGGVVDQNGLIVTGTGANQTVTGKFATDPSSVIGAFDGAGAGTAEAYLKQLLSSGLRGQQAADLVNQKFPNSVNWREDRNFFDFPGSNSYVHQTDQGGWAGPWDLVQRGPEGGGQGSQGNIDYGALASLNGITPFDYTGGGPSSFTPKTQPFVPTPFVAPEAKPEPGAFVAPTLDETNDPGYKFRLGQAQDSVQSAAAARGTLLTTGTLADVSDRVGQQASAEYANVYARAFGEQQNAYAQWLSSNQNTFGQALNTNQNNNNFGLNANINAFNQEYQTTQLNNAAQATGFNQQLQTHQTRYNDLYNLANLGYNSTNASFQ